jgi:hypothetical protein
MRQATPVVSVAGGSDSSSNRNNDHEVAPFAPMDPIASSPHSPAQVVSKLGNGQATSPVTSPTVSRLGRSAAGGGARPVSASSAVARRGVLMVMVYYCCWSLISLNAVFDLAGWHDRSVWWDIVGAWMAKCQPAIDAMILLQSMTKARERKEAMKVRSGMNDSQGPTSGLRNQPLSPTGAGQQQRLNQAISPRGAGNSTLRNQPVLLSPRGGSSAGAVRLGGAGGGLVGDTVGPIDVRPSSRVVAPRLDSPPIASNATTSGDDRGQAGGGGDETKVVGGEVNTESVTTAGNGEGLHRRTVSSEIVTY